MQSQCAKSKIYQGIYAYFPVPQSISKPNCIFPTCVRAGDCVRRAIMGVRPDQAKPSARLLFVYRLQYLRFGFGTIWKGNSFRNFHIILWIISRVEFQFKEIIKIEKFSSRTQWVKSHHINIYLGFGTIWKFV